MAFDLTLTPVEKLDAAETDPNLGMIAEAEEARLDGAVAAAPAARGTGGWPRVSTESGHRHDAILAPVWEGPLVAPERCPAYLGGREVLLLR